MAKSTEGIFDKFVDFFDKSTLIVISIGMVVLIAVLMVYLIGGVGNFVPNELKYTKLANGSLNTSDTLASATKAEALASTGVNLFDNVFSFLSSGVGMLTMVALIIIITFVIVAVRRTRSGTVD